jgi:Single cache domain 3
VYYLFWVYMLKHLLNRSSSQPHRVQSIWLNCSFRKKLTILLIVGATLPTGCVTHTLIKISEDQLLNKMRSSLQKDLSFFQQQQQQVETTHRLWAEGLASGIELAKLDTPSQTNLDSWLQNTADFTPSFYAITDTQGHTIAQKIQTLAIDSEALPTAQPVAPTYRSVSVATGIDLGQLAIVQAALQKERSLSGHEIVGAEVLQKLGLAQQAAIGVRAQKTAGLPPPKQPLPEGTYNLQQGKIGMLIIAVQPIKQNDRIVGTAIVGTLLNQNHTFVDRIRAETGVSTATLFAYDWRITTNVPTLDGNRRAIGTRAAREIAETVLQQGKPFVGTTNIVGQTYLTAYAPLYDYRHQLQPSQAKPIGILYVGNPDTKVVQGTQQLMSVG